MILVHFISLQGFKNEELNYPVYGGQLLLHVCDADNLNTEIKANLSLAPSYSKTFKNEGNKHYDDENLILTSLWTWDVCSRWYL